MQPPSLLLDQDQASVAAIIYPPEHVVDDLLRTIADRLAAGGWRIGGVIQSRQTDDGCAGMLLEDIQRATRRSIAQNLGKLSTSCKLDSFAVADIAAELERQIDAGLDLLIINRFGKLEFDGSGLRSAIERAVMADTPVLTCVRDVNRAGWISFHGGLGANLPPDLDTVTAWTKSALKRRSRT